MKSRLPKLSKALAWWWMWTRIERREEREERKWEERKTLTS
jgi:hypothetical protein